MQSAIKYAVVGAAVVLACGVVYLKYQSMRPCVKPITYQIIQVDSRFHIATSTLLKDAAFAANIWNSAAGKKLLEYSPTGEVPIRFIYDDRQASAQLGAQIAREEAGLERERQALDAGSPTQQMVNDYNARARALNARVDQYNVTAGATFKEGEYVRDESGARISIYEFSDNEQLERVLAHEFGHSLGLDHNDNPRSIMYAKNESGNIKPTPEDLAALTQLCGPQIRLR